MNMYGVHWLTRVRKGACRTGHAPKQWQTSMIKPIHKKGNKETRENAPVIGAYFSPVFQVVYAKCLEKKMP